MTTPHFISISNEALIESINNPPLPPTAAVLQAHYDFSSITSLWTDTGRTVQVTSDGDGVRGVTDLSGQGNHLDDGAGGGPQFRTNIQNGLSVVENFAASTEFLENTGFNLGSPHSWICVARTPASVNVSFGNSIVHSTTFPGNSTDAQLSPFLTTRYFSDETVFVDSVLQTPPTTSRWTIFVFEMDGVNNPIYQENVFDINHTAGALTRVNGLRLMHDSNIGGGFWDSYLAEAEFYDTGALGDAFRVARVNQLKTKWNIA